MASAHHPHSLKSDPTPAARHRPAPTPHGPPCTPLGPPGPTRPRMAADTTEPPTRAHRYGSRLLGAERKGHTSASGTPPQAPPFATRYGAGGGTKSIGENAERRCAALRCVGWCCARRALRILAAGAATLWTEGMPWPRDRCLLKELRPYGAAQLRGFQSTAPRLSARCAPQELRAMQPLGHKSEP